MGKRKAVWIHEDQYAYLEKLSGADLEKPSAAMRRVIQWLRATRIEKLDDLPKSDSFR